MASVKTLRQKLADEGLSSFIVTYMPADTDDAIPLSMQFWAEDADHAIEQMDGADEFESILMVETQDEYEARTGNVLQYGLEHSL